MLPLYLFCLVVGGGLLLFSLLGADSDGAGADVGADARAHLDLHAHDGDYAHEFFSMRALLYFLAGFGATGSLLELLTGASPLVAAVWAVATGVVGGTGAASLFAWLRRSESGIVPAESGHLVGLAARVVVPVGPERRGTVVVVTAGREVELLARLFSSEDPSCPRGSTVVIVDIEDAVALVTPLPALPADPS